MTHKKIKMTINERHSEKLVEQKMWFDLGSNEFWWVFAQWEHANARIDNALTNAWWKPDLCEINDYTKWGKWKAKPEYIITFKWNDNTIIVVECKSDPKMHCSMNYNQPKKYAVDGVLYYAKYLKEYYNVIAVAVSWTKTWLFRSSMFYRPRWQEIYQEYTNAQNVLLSANNYLELVNGKELRSTYKLQDVKELAIMMHESLRTVKMTEKLKPLCIAWILIALQDKSFSSGYKDIKDFDTLLLSCESAIDRVLHDWEIPEKKIKEIKTAFGQIDWVIQLKKKDLSEDGSLRHYINILEMNIKPMMYHIWNTIDALWVFYHEFITYSSWDWNTLWIVLTPQHLTEFMAELINVNKNDKVLDICCGSWAFLVTAMGMMFKNATPDEIEYIRKNNLYGIEQDSDIHTLALANMIVRQDGKSNIIHWDCFDKEAYSKLQDLTDTNWKRISINKWLLNPPYSQKDHTELEFVEQELMLLDRWWELAVVCPMSCAIWTKFKEERRRLMEKHTLKAVFSMPNDIFYWNNASTNVCVMVRKAHEPHDSEVPTFFWYYKDDGFVKKKKLWRIDYYNKWEWIKKEWINLYKKWDVKDWLTAKACVTYKDEWLCEAYMKTDYSNLSEEDFQKTVNNYLAYLIGNWDVFES